jgi:hypothetical protein
LAGLLRLFEWQCARRFAATINLAFPVPPPFIKGLPPSHLLRWVFENCPDCVRQEGRSLQKHVPAERQQSTRRPKLKAGNGRVLADSIWTGFGLQHDSGEIAEAVDVGLVDLVFV